MQTLYEILEVSENASKEVIDKTYKILVKRYHPDLQTSEEDKKKAEVMMQKVNEAYDIISDDAKRLEYDSKLKEKRGEEENTKNENNDYSNINENAQVYEQQNVEQKEQYYNKAKTEETWQEKFAKLSPMEQRKVRKQIEKNANAEYRKIYEDYFRSLGYRVKHKPTWKEIEAILIVIAIIIAIFYVGWIIPPIHNWMTQLYTDNVIIRIFVDLIKGIGIGIYKSFKLIFSGGAGI